MTVHVGESSPHDKIETNRRKADSLARRPGTDGLPNAIATGPIGVRTMPAGSFSDLGFEQALTNNSDYFTHLPLLGGDPFGGITDVDGALVALKRGIYRLFAHVTLNNSGADLLAAQLGTVHIVQATLAAPGYTAMTGSWGSIFNVGGTNGAQSSILGGDLAGDLIWDLKDVILGSGASFAPTVFKVRFQVGSANPVGFTGFALSATWLGPVPSTDVTGDGIPADYAPV